MEYISRRTVSGAIGYLLSLTDQEADKELEEEWGRMVMVLAGAAALAKGEGNPGAPNPQEGLAMDIDAKNPNGVIVLTA